MVPVEYGWEILTYVYVHITLQLVPLFGSWLKIGVTDRSMVSRVPTSLISLISHTIDKCVRREYLETIMGSNPKYLI